MKINNFQEKINLRNLNHNKDRKLPSYAKQVNDRKLNIDGAPTRSFQVIDPDMKAMQQVLVLVNVRKIGP